MTPEQARKIIADEAVSGVIHAVKHGKPGYAQTLTLHHTVRAEIAEAAASDQPDVPTAAVSDSPFKWTAECN